MALSLEHVLGFSGNGKLFAQITEHGALRVWDTETNELKQEFRLNFDVAESCTALLWIMLSQEKKFKKGCRLEKYSKDSLYIAMGTSIGRVVLYSHELGKIERILKDEGHSGKVTAITFDNCGKLFTCGEDCQIIVWELSAGKHTAAWYIGNEKPHSIVYMKYSNSLVVGAREIKVYSVSTHELLQTFTGHTSEVHLMTPFIVNEHVEYVITTSKMERIICLWKIGEKVFNKRPTCTLLMEDLANTLTCEVENEENLKVASVTRSGVIHVYLISIDRINCVKPTKPNVTIEIACQSAVVIQPICAVAAFLQAGNHPQQILFGYGDMNFLVFEYLELNFLEKVQVLVRSDPKKLNTEGKKEKKTVSTLKTATPLTNSHDVDYKSSMHLSKKKFNSLELPMESRLQNLHLNTPDGTVVPQAQSKVQLLVQALHSKDETLLRSVLCTNDMKVIQLTLQKLPVQYVGILVNKLTLLMQQKRINVEISMNWLKILAQTHSSQLLAHGADDLLSKFGPCIGIIEHRANCLTELSKLNGRLQLLVSQIKINTEGDNLNSENVLVLEDNDSSNSEIEDTFDKSTSDGEWEEGDDESAEDNEDEEMETVS